jgi:hypothetical protein
MRSIRCWALLPDGTRCPLESLHGGYFCADHPMGCQPNPALIFRAPVAEMPNDLVQYLRAAAPDIAFPEAPLSPLISSTPPPASPAEPPSEQADCSPVDTAAAVNEPALSPESGSEPTAPPHAVSAPEECRQPQHPSEGRRQLPTTPVAAASEAHENDCGGDADPGGFDWLLGMIKEAVTGVMASDCPPLQKAQTVHRLGGLYLKAHRAAELQRENTLLKKRLAELEPRLAALDPPNSDEEAGASRSPGQRMPVHPAQASTSVPGGVTATCSPSPPPAIAPGQQHPSPPRHRPGRSGGGRRR